MLTGENIAGGGGQSGFHLIFRVFTNSDHHRQNQFSWSFYYLGTL